MQSQIVLVTGVTGYIGGRLVPQLIEAGYHVRVLARDKKRLQGRAWLKQVDVFEGDVLDPVSLAYALSGVSVAYYLVHSMSGSVSFDQRDLQAARNFGTAAAVCGVERIIYLGGLGDPQADLSIHLRSRQQTGQALKESGVPVTEFRAAIVVGSGSVSFEMIRYLTERLPVMVCPLWVFTRVQPIAIDDVLDYLAAALKIPESAGRIIEIGGSDVLTYGEMMLGYARVRGLRRWLLAVPVLTPRLSSYWVHIVTPVPARIAQPLIEGLRNEVVVRDHAARNLFPQINPRNYQTAVTEALSEAETRHVETSWSDALVNSQGDILPVVLSTQEGMIIERRQQIVSTPPVTVFKMVSRLGGRNGWLYLNWAWTLRGWVDRLIGGVGLRRGRRDPEAIRIGDAIDFWRVEAVELERRLLLRAEMKLPGRAWLQFEVYPFEQKHSRLVQTAFFDPKGLSGLAYWYLLYPIHRIIFAGMIRTLAQKALDYQATLDDLTKIPEAYS
jgi:uncharacterized protein YbjT (DUF2867 family)